VVRKHCAAAATSAAQVNTSEVLFIASDFPPERAIPQADTTKQTPRYILGRALRPGRLDRMARMLRLTVIFTAFFIFATARPRRRIAIAPVESGARSVPRRGGEA
jgi:hypothetical protein